MKTTILMLLATCLGLVGCVGEDDTGTGYDYLTGACTPPNSACSDRYHAQYCQTNLWQPALDCRTVCAVAGNPSGCCGNHPEMPTDGCMCCGTATCYDRPTCLP